MTDQHVIETAGAAQVPLYVPTQREIRAAISAVLAEDFALNGYGGEEIVIPVRIEALIRDAFDRANAGEFRA